MVSRLFGSNPFDESVEKATSEKGQEDLALNLEISDQIRSKQVQPKDAMRALKRKITHTNPSVQLLALSLTDTCVKNGGQHFLIEIASREFVDSLVGIAKAPPSACSPEVKTKLLGLIQTWALAFEGKPELIYVTETYRLLKHEGYVFPKVDKSTSNILIDTATPPEWSDSDYCVRCRTPFTLMNRKHHCRNCGQTFCGECSSKTAPLPNIGINEPVRVCDACFIKRQLKTKGPENRHQTLYSGFPITNGNDNRESSESEEDEDYKKAIELSLKEKEKVTRRESIKQLEQRKEEEELAAAIAESLKDTKPKPKPRYPTRTQPTSIDILDTQKEQNEISEIEADNIHKFSDLLERIQQSGSDLIRNRQVQELHDRIGELKPKLTKNLTETIQRHQDLVEMHEKLSRVIKLYDRLLEDRMSNTYSRHSSSSIYAGVTSPVSSNAGIVVHPSIQQPPANLYQNSLYPLASAPSPSPTYFPPQVSHTQYAQPSTLEIVPILNQPPLPSLQQISYGTVGAVGTVGTVSYLPQQTFQNFDANSGFTQIQQNQSSQPNNYYNHPPQDPSSQLIVHQQPQKVEEASLIEL